MLGRHNMGNKPILMDGAVGTTLWEIADRHGVERVPVWRYNIEHPELVEELARNYAEAGSEIILSNTMAANRPAVEGGSDYDPCEIVKLGVRLVKKALEGTGCKTCLAIGPLSTLMEPFGTLKKADAARYFGEMVDAGMSEGADCIYIQTFLDLEMMKVAAAEALRYDVPVYCTMTFEKHGKTLMGNTVEKVIAALEPMGVAGVGMNCSLGPELALPIIKEFAEKASVKVVFKPNAGMPVMQEDGTMKIEATAQIFAQEVAPALEYVDFIGGCCNCNDEFVREIKKLMD